MKTSELIGPALDWAVAKCEGRLHETSGRGATRFNGVWIDTGHRTGTTYVLRDARFEEQYSHCDDWPLYANQKIWAPSTNWAQGGPIIEREKIGILQWEKGCEGYLCREHEHDYYLQDSLHGREVGPSPLIAAMRCYVASKLGEEVAIPKELCNEK